MQIYKGLDVGTAKVTVEERENIPHHLIDICNITDKFSVADFKNMCYDKIEEIVNRGKNVVIVGGTGLYINSIVYDLSFKEQNIDLEYRKELENLAHEHSKEYVYEMLLKVDENSAKNIHPNNLKRVIRALEMAHESNLKSEHMKSETNRLSNFIHPKYNFFVYCIDYPRDMLYDRINKRIDIMVQDGLLKEARMVYDMKLEPSNTCMQAIGYKEFFDYFENKETLNEAIERLKKNTRHYAKRQITWFKNSIKCKHIDGTTSQENLVNYIINYSGIIDGETYDK